VVLLRDQRLHLADGGKRLARDYSLFIMSIDRRRFLKSSAIAGLGATAFPMTSFAAQNTGVGPAPMMPTPNFVETNGIKLAVYEKGTGPAIVFCHGFPELAFSWRNQIDAVAAAGYHALAPD